MTHICRICGVELNDDNWYPSLRKYGNYICKEHYYEKTRVWIKKNVPKVNAYAARAWKKNPERLKEIHTKSNRKRGMLPYDKNKKCSSFLGVYVAEDVLSAAFINVQKMPMHNPGFDFICGQGCKIDVKSACLGTNGSWTFHIRNNSMPDYFACLAFDNRTSLNVLHAWLLPGNKFNHLTGTSICPTTIHKWDEYKISMDKISARCATMKDEARATAIMDAIP